MVHAAPPLDRSSSRLLYVMAKTFSFLRIINFIWVRTSIRQWTSSSLCVPQAN